MAWGHFYCTRHAVYSLITRLGATFTVLDTDYIVSLPRLRATFIVLGTECIVSLPQLGATFN